jgi:phosphoglycolate phosphatase-like HAD superfamily hydrolase
MLEIIRQRPESFGRLRVAIFDFDGTISTLRHGWEQMMEPLMVEMICGPHEPTEQIAAEVRDYIDQSTGIQTVFQMQWLVDAVRRHGMNPVVHDAWWYKREYNRRLMMLVNDRLELLRSGRAHVSDFVIQGSVQFVKLLAERGLEVHIASGTDHPDVVNEATSLGLLEAFAEISGAPVDRADDSKEAVFRRLIDGRGLRGCDLLVVGDGRVEIRLGRQAGATTLGVASDERQRQGVNQQKRRRLLDAGSDAITGDFTDQMPILSWLGLD